MLLSWSFAASSCAMAACKAAASVACPASCSCIAWLSRLLAIHSSDSKVDSASLMPGRPVRFGGAEEARLGCQLPTGGGAEAAGCCSEGCEKGGSGARDWANAPAATAAAAATVTAAASSAAAAAAAPLQAAAGGVAATLGPASAVGAVGGACGGAAPPLSCSGGGVIAGKAVHSGSA